MSNVNLDIAGRRYTIACAAGEEAHIEMLGRSIDEKLAKMPAMTGQSEPRTLLFAALLLADELHEAQGKVAAAPPAQPDHAAPLENLAERLETLATQLERSSRSS